MESLETRPDSHRTILMNKSGPIVVIGATGNQGGQVAHQLLAAGWTVRAVTRHPAGEKARQLSQHGAEVVKGDLADPRTLKPIVQDAVGIFSVQNVWDLGMQTEILLGSHIIETAQATGHQPHVVYASGLGAEKRQGIGVIDGKAILEDQLRQSGLPFTIVRPGLFMDDFLGASLPFPPAIQQILSRHRLWVGRWFLATLRAVMVPDHPVPLTTLRDVGNMVQWAFEDPHGSHDQTYELIGTAQAASTLCAQWNALMPRPIPRICGLAQGLRLIHPQMAALLHWLRKRSWTPTPTPLRLQTYEEWLTRVHQTGCRSS